jgi:acyl dehydratase
MSDPSTARVGDALPALEIPLTRSGIVAAALASRDFQAVHHDHEVAQARGSRDIFMNILATQGLVARFVTDWAGPNAVLRRNAIRLGAPNYPGDTMRLTGEILDRRDGPTGTELDITITGRNSLGDHVSGTVTVRFAAGDGAP